MLSSYSQDLLFLINSTTFSTSSSSTKQPWTRLGFDAPIGAKSISPLPRSLSAPPESRIVLESICDLTAKAIRLGMLALIIPVMTSTDGLCVAITRCIPAARAICASRQIAFSTSLGAAIIRSASSSIIITICSSFLSFSFLGGFPLFSVSEIAASIICRSSGVCGISNSSEFSSSLIWVSSLSISAFVLSTSAL